MTNENGPVPGRKINGPTYRPQPTKSTSEPPTAETVRPPGLKKRSEVKQDQQTRQATLWSDAWRTLRKNPYFIVGASLSTLYVLIALFPMVFARGIDPRDADVKRYMGPPSSQAWFGYDQQGADLYANVIYAARSSMTLALITTVSVAIIGIVVGALAGYYGGILDMMLSRVIEVFYAIPGILAAMLVLYTVFSEYRNVWTVSAALIAFGWMSPARLIRSGVLSVKESDYVAAAKVLGAPVGRIILRHVLPNTVAPLIIFCTIMFGQMIAAEAALSFIGIGLPPDAISWGLQIEDGRNRLRDAPHLTLIPGIAISLAVLSFILMGDALREALDPKNR